MASNADGAQAVSVASMLMTEFGAKLAASGLSEDVVARAAHVAFLQIAGDVVGQAALVEWLRNSADQIEARLFAAMDAPLQ